MVVRKQKSLIVLASFLTCLSLLVGVSAGFAKDSQALAPAQVSQQKVSINKASLQELETVRGIGPVIAQRVMDYRAANGAFKSLEELSQVNGIGKVKYERMKEQLTL